MALVTRKATAKTCGECGEGETNGLGPIGTYVSRGAGMVKGVHQFCGRRALEFANAGSVDEVMILVWPTNRRDEKKQRTGLAVLAQFSTYIASMSEDEVAAHGGVEGRLLEVAGGVVLPHMVADAGGPASCTASEWWALVAEARSIWHEQVAERALLESGTR